VKKWRPQTFSRFTSKIKRLHVPIVRFLYRDSRSVFFSKKKWPPSCGFAGLFVWSAAAWARPGAVVHCSHPRAIGFGTCRNKAPKDETLVVVDGAASLADFIGKV
jgi:hypothetical protein